MKIFAMIIGALMLLSTFKTKSLSVKGVIFLCIYYLIAASLVLFPLYLEFMK